jgi:hypothetical protein
MGVALSSLTLLLNEHKRRPFGGTLLQLGRQDIYFDYATLCTFAQKAGVKLTPVPNIGVRLNQWMPGVQTLDEQTFFKSIGFDTVLSLDTSDYEQAEFIYDLNHPLPESMHGKFDVVFDGGSLEHIFHVPNALWNIHAMLKTDGRAIHHSPTHNYVDHGFYCFSPTLYYDYYEAAGYSDLRCHFVGHTLPYTNTQLPKVFTYKPGDLESVSIGGITKEKFQGCEMFMTIFSATKTENARAGTIPTQRRYQQWWAKAKAGVPY